MALETGTYINNLVKTNPAVGDPIRQGDDHIRLIKSVLRDTFPNASKAFRLQTRLGADQSADYTVAATEEGKTHYATKSGKNDQTITLATNITATGWQITIKNARSNANGTVKIAPGASKSFKSNSVSLNSGNITLEPREYCTIIYEGSDVYSVLEFFKLPATFATSQIPNLPASKITSGQFDVAQIPDLDAAKITTGTLASARIPGLNGNKITSGTIAKARLPSDITDTSQHITGEIKAFAFSSAPDGWLVCDGSAQNRTTYSDLWDAISDTWGEGDGSTTFNLPNFQRAALIGSGGSKTGRSNGPGATVGSTGGAEQLKLKLEEMPAYGQNIASWDEGTGSHLVLQTQGSAPASTSGGMEHANMPPSAVVLWCIKT